MYREPRQAVVPRAQGKRAMVFHQHLTHEHKADALPVWLRGKERRKEFGSCLLVDAATRVGNLEDGTPGTRPDVDSPLLPDALDGILENVHQHLLEKDHVQVHPHRFGRQVHDEGYPAFAAHRLQELHVHTHHFVQVGMHEDGVGNLHHVGKVGDEAAHVVTPLDADPHQLAQLRAVGHILHRRLQRVERGCHPRDGVVHLVGYHADDFLVSLALSLAHLFGQQFDEIERVAESPVQE